MTATPYIDPKWPAPSNIQALTTTRHYQTIDQIDLPSSPLTLSQIHGNDVIKTDNYKANMEADGLYTTKPQTVLSIQTADCLPVLLCDQQGKQIAAIHAGWRGLANQIIFYAYQQFKPNSYIMAWIGPSISQPCYQVDTQLRNKFTSLDNKLEKAFKPIENQPNQWLADLKWIARYQLVNCGIQTIITSSHCTYSEPNLFYSYRRNQGATGRLYTLIWISS